jgi:hypothetical protein
LGAAEEHKKDGLRDIIGEVRVVELAEGGGVDHVGMAAEEGEESGLVAVVGESLKEFMVGHSGLRLIMDVGWGM